jgi:hypothetical protein
VSPNAGYFLCSAEQTECVVLIADIYRKDIVSYEERNDYRGVRKPQLYRSLTTQIKSKLWAELSFFFFQLLIYSFVHCHNNKHFFAPFGKDGVYYWDEQERHKKERFSS